MAANVPLHRAQWVKFEKWDINDSILFETLKATETSPLPKLIFVGHDNGIRIWLIKGDENELVFSLNRGPVKIAHILPTPANDHESLAVHRPIMALCETSNESKQFFSVTFLAMKTGCCVIQEQFSSEVEDIKCNKKMIAVALADRIVTFWARTLKKTFVVMSFPNPGSFPQSRTYPNPIAVDDSSLAYSGDRLYPWCRSAGGILSAGRTYKSIAIEISETVSGFFSGSNENSPLFQNPSRAVPPINPLPGVATVIYCYEYSAYYRESSKVDIPIIPEIEMSLVRAHFPAHNEPVAALAFDPRKNLLTMSSSGLKFNVFKILEPTGLSEVSHLCWLYCTNLSDMIQDIAFSSDGLWVSAIGLSGLSYLYFVTYNLRTEKPKEAEYLESLLSEKKTLNIKQQSGTKLPFVIIKHPAIYDEQSAGNKSTFDKAKLLVAAEFSSTGIRKGNNLNEVVFEASLLRIDCFGCLHEYGAKISFVRGSYKSERDCTSLNRKLLPLWGPFLNEATPPLTDDNPLIVCQKSLWELPKVVDFLRPIVISNGKATLQDIVKAVTEFSLDPPSDGKEHESSLMDVSSGLEKQCNFPATTLHLETEVNPSPDNSELSKQASK